MLARKRRAPRALLEKVIQGGKSFFSPHFSFRLLKNNLEEPSLFAFVVSSKVEKLAVSRNMLRRRGSYVIQKVLRDIKTGFVGVFFFKKGAKDIPYKELEKEILETLQKTSLL